MFTLGCNYENPLDYVNSPHLRQFEGSIYWQENEEDVSTIACADVLEHNAQQVKLIWKSTNDYMPIEYLYKFITDSELTLVNMHKDIKIEGNITISTITINCNIRYILEIFNFN